MAPLTNEPDAIRVVLNLPRRKAYYSLVCDITKYMRTQLELPQLGPDNRSTPARNPPPPYSETAAAPRTDSPGSNRQQGSQNGPGSPPPRLPPRHPGPAPASPALVRLRKAALLHFDSWRSETLAKLKEVLSKADDQKVVDARRKRAEELSVKAKQEASAGEDLLSFGDNGVSTGNPSGSANPQDPSRKVDPTTVSAFQNLYHPIPTRLTTVPLEDRKEVLSSTLILLLSIGNYSAYSRTLVCYITSALELPPNFLNAEETEIATTMVEAAQKADAEKQKNGGMSAEAEAQKRKEEGQVGRFWKVGLASVAGAAIIGVTGGLAAPAVAGVIGGLMGSVGLGGLASFLGIFWMNGALVGTLFGAFGAKMTGEIVDQYAKEVEDFKFMPLKEEWGKQWSNDGPESRRLRVTIGINGWLAGEEDVTKPWRVLGDESEVFALRYEMKSLMELGAQLRALVTSRAWGVVRTEILRRTVLATLQGALWPIFLLNSASNIDNPFSLARNRSEKAGKILADALINKVQGERPVTLIGYSLGARVIYSCLRVLAERKAFGLVDTVVLIGAPVPSNTGHWQMMRTVVSGKLFNVFSENDFILAFLYRTTSLQLGIAGLQAIVGSEDGQDVIDGVENLDLSNEVMGHLRYPELIAKILTRCGFPNNKGGEEAIEKENVDDEIQLRDKDFAETGNLIDFDDGEDDGAGKKKEQQHAQTESPELHPRDRLKERQNEKFDPSVKNVQELKSDSILIEQRLLGSAKTQTKSTETSTPTPTASTTTSGGMSSMPNLHEQSRSPEPPAPPLPQRAASTSQVQGPPPAYTGPDAGIDGGILDYEYDDDADEYAGEIRMEDNDSDEGEMTMVEPLVIQD
ncbi:DUF726-domain-containing protein [Xylariomycetidae sp. FL2044]|nr:DUF726-domain-containing protein [Xylariomycetidae sp. FL2044]